MAVGKTSLTVIVPALDEEAHLERAVREIRAVVEPRFDEWEILVFDDGSTDGTGRIADALAASDSRIRAFHNAVPRNVGAVYKQGLAAARCEHVILVPGDGENGGRALEAPLDAVGRADIVLPYPTNSATRGLGRHLLSRTYTRLLNLLFGLELPYYNGTVVHRTSAVRGVDLSTDSFAYQSEALVKLLRAGHDFVAVGIEIEPPAPGRRTRALRPKNILGVVRAVARLTIDARLRRGDAHEVHP